MLQNKYCINCNNEFLTCAEHPLCRTCMQYQCEYAGMKIPDGRTCCTSTFDLINYNGKNICFGHFKRLQSRCKVCGTPRTDSEFQSDYMWYCSTHRTEFKQNMFKNIHEVFETVLHKDETDLICDYLFDNQFCHPDEFRMCKNSLKIQG